MLFGRAWLYALGAAGEAGVYDLLGMIEKELRVAMTLTGVTSIGGIDRSVLAGTMDQSKESS